MRKWAIPVILVLCMWPALAAGQAVTGGTLIWGRGGDSVSLDLANATDGESIKAGIQVLENLVIFGKNSMDVEPQLAESWKVSDDGLTWTFKLRKGVKFHDGTAFNAKAVYDSFARVIDKNIPFTASANGSTSTCPLAW
jgi:peptide/nickel transport system substrate-binding protein